MLAVMTRPRTPPPGVLPPDGWPADGAAPPAPRLLAISDLHAAHRGNEEVVQALAPGTRMTGSSSRAMSPTASTRSRASWAACASASRACSGPRATTSCSPVRTPRGTSAASSGTPATSSACAPPGSTRRTIPIPCGKGRAVRRSSRRSSPLRLRVRRRALRGDGHRTPGACQGRSRRGRRRVPARSGAVSLARGVVRGPRRRDADAPRRPRFRAPDRARQPLAAP